MKRIAVFTSGGDSPGMNACIRAVVKTALQKNIQVHGIMRGYQGMIEGDFKELSYKDIANIVHKGGTILKSARSKDFMTKDGREKAFQNLKEFQIDGVVAIGGDGTFTGASIFMDEFNIPFIGLPGTIDNDLFGTDNTIGYDTALNTVVEAVDKIRDTATSHDRLFIVEVMGKDAGFIALRSGIAVGSAAVLVPETTTYIDKLLSKLKSDYRDDKKSNIVIVAEGDEFGGAYKVANHIKSEFSHFDIRVSILGHMQRGGNPSAYDRVLSSRLGVASVEALVNGRKSEMIGVVNNELAYTTFDKAIKHNKGLNSELLKLAESLGN